VKTRRERRRVDLDRRSYETDETRETERGARQRALIVIRVSRDETRFRRRDERKVQIFRDADVVSARYLWNPRYLWNSLPLWSVWR
jgi:hypothetical protein